MYYYRCSRRDCLRVPMRAWYSRPVARVILYSTVPVLQLFVPSTSSQPVSVKRATRGSEIGVISLITKLLKLVSLTPAGWQQAVSSNSHFCQPPDLSLRPSLRTGQLARSPLMTVRIGVGTYFYWSAGHYQHGQMCTCTEYRSPSPHFLPVHVACAGNAWVRHTWPTTM